MYPIIIHPKKGEFIADKLLGEVKLKNPNH
jgi:hypothetical protein